LVTGSARGPGREVRPDLFGSGEVARLAQKSGVARADVPMAREGCLPSGG
jgi:hypothetical protein